jgi:hypothetical protein
MLLKVGLNTINQTIIYRNEQMYMPWIIAMLDVGHVSLNIMTQIPDWCFKYNSSLMFSIYVEVCCNYYLHFSHHSYHSYPLYCLRTYHWLFGLEKTFRLYYPTYIIYNIIFKYNIITMIDNFKYM